MANNNYYLGQDPQSALGDTPRFFYGLRKNANGSVFLERSDHDRALFYYVNNEGELVVKINTGHTYNNLDSEG